MDEQEVLALEELTSIVKSKEKPFQIFVKTINGKTITINDVTSDMTILSIMRKIEDKEGLPVEIQRLTTGTKELRPEKTVKDYGITKEATLHSLLRLKGGLGERMAMKYVLDKKMNRGNVEKEIRETKGESRALKDWGRNLKKNGDFWAKIRTKVGLDGEINKEAWRQWRIKNYIHVTALIQETTHSGNCGDFAQITHSKLVRSTSDQYVYILTMCNPMPDKYQNPKGAWMRDTTEEERKEWFLANSDGRKQINETRRLAKRHSLRPANFDHQMCITYHKSVYNLIDMDFDRATIADGWDGNMVCSLDQFVKGRNAYGMAMDAKRLGLDYPNLRISSGQQADNSGGLEGLGGGILEFIQDEIDTRLDDYKSNGTFKADRKAAINNGTGIFDMAPRTYLKDLTTDETIKKKLDKIVLPDEVDTFKNECLDLTPDELLFYWASVVNDDHGAAIRNDDEIKAHLYDGISNASPSNLEAACNDFMNNNQFMDYFYSDAGVPTLVMATSAADKLANILESEANPLNIVRICNALSDGDLGEVFSKYRNQGNMTRIITALWGNGAVAKGDVCVNAMTHLPSLGSVLSSYTGDEIESYLTRQNIWTNKVMLYGYRKNNKPTLKTVIQQLSTPALKNLRTSIGIDKWNADVQGKLTNEQKDAL